MQYSPYPQSMNPYHVIYNNGGAAAYNQTWGYTDAFAQAVGYTPIPPAGYSRQQYEEERALAVESMWKSPLFGLASFGLSTAAMWTIWGSPLKGLVETFGGDRAASLYNAGFSGIPGVSDIGNARAVEQELRRDLRRAIRKGAGTAEINALNAQIAGAQARVANLNAARYATDHSFFGRLGKISGGFSDFKNQVGNVTNTIFKKVVSEPVGSVVDFGVSRVTGVAESMVNRFTGGGLNTTTAQIGDSLYSSMRSSDGFLNSLFTSAQTYKREEKVLSDTIKNLTSQLGADGLTDDAAKNIASQLRRAERKLSSLQGPLGLKGLWTKSAGKASTILSKVGSVLKTRGIGGVMGMAAGGIATAGMGLAGWLASTYLNPVTAAEMYLIGQATEYASDAYQNYQTENEIKRNLMTKGSRALAYGFADASRGLDAGFTGVQRDQIVQKIRNMAEIGANRGDLLGLGSMSLFGGHARYSERLRELKSILNVGMDMGFFDMSKSIDDFEKKFEQTVKTVDKLSKFLKKTKGEVMTMMANVQQTEGLYNMSDIQASVLRKDYAARLSGADITTVMQESVAGGQMARQYGFSQALGARVMSGNRVMLSNAIRAGDIDRETLFAMGGEESFVANAQQGFLNMFMDEEMATEAAMDYEFNAKTGRYERTGKRAARYRNANDAELRRMSHERELAKTKRSFSRVKQMYMAGGELYDKTYYYNEDRRKNKISSDDLMERAFHMIRQRQLMYYGEGRNSAEADELLAQGIAHDFNVDADTARVMAKTVRGGYENFKTMNDLNVAVNRYKTAYEQSGMGAWTILKETFFSKAGLNYRMAGATASGIAGTVGSLFVSGGTTAAATGAIGAVSSAIGSIGGHLAYHGEGLWNNWYNPRSYAAMQYNEDVMRAMGKAGYNESFVARYLTGAPSNAEILAGFNPKVMANAAKAAGKLGLQVNDAITMRRGSTSSHWDEMTAFSVEANEANEYVNRWLDNNIKRGRNDGGFKAYLSGLEALGAQEMGLTMEERGKLVANLKAIREGQSVNLYEMDGNVKKLFGSFLTRAIQKADLTSSQTDDILRNLVVDANGTTEKDIRNIGLLSTQNLGVTELDYLFNSYGDETAKSLADRKLGVSLNKIQQRINNDARRKGVLNAGGWVGVGAGVALIGAGLFSGGLTSLAGAALLAGGSSLTGAGAYSFYAAKENQEAMNLLGEDITEFNKGMDEILSGENGAQDAEDLYKAFATNSGMDSQERAFIMRKHSKQLEKMFGERGSALYKRYATAWSHGKADQGIADLIGISMTDRLLAPQRPFYDAWLKKRRNEYRDDNEYKDDVALLIALSQRNVYGGLTKDEEKLKEVIEKKMGEMSGDKIRTYIAEAAREGYISLSTESSRKMTLQKNLKDIIDSIAADSVNNQVLKEAGRSTEVNTTGAGDKVGGSTADVSHLNAQTAENCVYASKILRECVSRLGY